MELGELLYNKSEYIETVRLCPGIFLPFPSLRPFEAGAPLLPLRLPHPGSLWRLVRDYVGSLREWLSFVTYSLHGQFRLFKFIHDFIVEI